MVDKKRKGAIIAEELPKKKSKQIPARDATKEKTKSKKSDSKHDNTPSIPSTTSNNAVATSSKKSRKRAADFLSDDETQAPTTATPPTNGVATQAEGTLEAPQKKKSKKSKKTADLTADGVNGVLEREGEKELKPVSSKHPVSQSLQAEAQRTADKELEDEFGFNSEAEEVDNGEDHGAALLAGFDSDTSDHGRDENLDLSRTPALPQYKKTQKLLRKAKEQGSDGSGTVYVGRIPHGFYEQQMREYFSQFGEITKLRLSRNKRTGASKHFAFIEFKSDEVAKIVAETMDNYLMFGHILKCKYAPEDSLHPDVWKGANKKYRKIPHEKLEKENLASPKDERYWARKVVKEQLKRDKKAEKLQAMGYEVPKSTLAQPTAVLQQRRLEAASKPLPKQIESAPSSEQEPTGAIEPPKGVPLDSVALEKASKKKNKSNKKDVASSASAPDSDTKPVTKSKPVVKEKPTQADPSDAVDAELKPKKSRKSEKSAEQLVVEKKGTATGKEVKSILKKPNTKKPKA